VVNLGTTVFGRWLKKHCGAKASEKHIPDVILRHADSDVRRAFLEGLNAGDGYEHIIKPDGSHRTYCVKTSSKSLMHDLVLLLAQDSLGCHTRVEAQRPRSNYGKPLPDGKLYGVQWNPDGPRETVRVLNGKTVTSTSHRWKADEFGVWYPIKSVSRCPFEGLVYNMETDAHTYIAHGYLVHNCDASVNDDLRDAGCSSIAADGVLPAKIGCADHQTAEHYFAAIQQRRAQQQPKPQSGNGGQGQSPQGKGQQPGGQGAGQGQHPGQQGAGGQGQPKFKGCGSGAGSVGAPCELPVDDDMDGQAPAAGEIERERIRVATAGTIREHAAKGRGTVPAGLIEQAEQILAPAKIPWRQVLSSAIRRAVAIRQGDFDVTYWRRHRRTPSFPFGGARVLRPGTFTPQPTLAVVRDTSGSMTDGELTVVTSEVEGIAKQLGIRGDDLKVLDVDAAVAAVRKYNGAQTLAEVAGRGGTDMRVGIEAALEIRPAVNAIIVLSDGFTPWPEERPGRSIPVVACIVGPGGHDIAEHIPDWMVAVVVDED
jgi:hypothetical protein